MTPRGAALAGVLLALLAGPAARAAAADAPAAAASAAHAHCPPPAVAPTPDQAREAMRAATDHGVLWKATKDGRVVWLYGTIHVAEQGWMYPGPQVLQAVRASDEIALELDVTDPFIAMRLQTAIVRQDDTPTLPAALQRRLDQQVAAACMDPQQLAPLRPEMQAVTVSVMQGRAQGLYPEYGIDAFLAVLGHQLKKPVRSLETPESQAHLLVSDDPAETAKSVTQALDELEAGKDPQMLARLAGDWARGDLADLERYAQWCGCLDTPELRADFVKLVDERNPLMADQVVQWHAAGKSLFVAVGTLHMVGPAGLPALLKARGFQVERVSWR